MQKSFQSIIQKKIKKSLAFKIQRILQEKTKFQTLENISENPIFKNEKNTRFQKSFQRIQSFKVSQKKYI